MSANATQADEAQEATNNDDFSALDANNFVRGNKGGCLLITKNVQGDEVETAYIAVNRTFFRVQEFGTPSKVERHTMSAALENARKNGHSAELRAYGQSKLDIEGAIRTIVKTFELDDKDSKAGFGLPKRELDDADDAEFDSAAAPIDNSAVHGGGW